ncbi:MAG: ABC transporter ATP-binding protein [Clostridiales bacterium]|nr:ABC transporter ATP-binding protein [Clostridiales bacterium]
MQTENDTVSRIAFDLTADGRLCSGELIFSHGVLRASIGGETVFERGVHDCAELKQFTDIGCGSLELAIRDPEAGAPAGDGDQPKALDDSENIRICRFTMAHVNEAAELCKVVNYYITTGSENRIIYSERRRCEKCGRPLMQGTDICMFCVDKGYILKRAFRTMRPFLGRVIVSSLIVSAAHLLYALNPILYRILTDDFLANPDNIKQYFASPAAGIMAVALAMIVARAAGQVLYIFSTRMSNRVSSEYSNSLRSQLYEKIQLLSMSAISKKTSGDLIKRVTGDTETIKDFLTNQGRYAIEITVELVFVIAILFVTNWKLTLLVLFPVPIMLFLTQQFWKFIHVRYDKQWRADSRSNSILHDIIKGIRVVKTFGSEEREIGKFSDCCRKLAEISASNEKTWAKVFPALEFLVGIGEFFVLYVGGRMVLADQMSLGELIQFVLYLSYIYSPLRWMSSLPRWIAQAMTSMVKVFEILDEKPEITDAKEPEHKTVEGAIEFKNVRFGYKAYEPVLKNVNVKIRPGEMIGLVGPSGSGKSTMINLLMRLYDPNGGSISIDGTDIRDIAQRDLHDQMGAVFQETFLFAGTIYDNITYAKEDAAYEEVIAAAKAANAHEFIMNLPDGYNTIIGENGHNLSGGERQRLSIARAVLKNPKILILDEATSSLDPKTESLIQDALERLVENRTTIAIAHRLATLRHADRLVVIDRGHIAEVGSHKELLEKKGIYYRLVMAQRQTAKLKN